MKFIEYKTAQALKEQGFVLDDNEILAKYDSDGEFYSLIGKVEPKKLKNAIIAPTTDQVLDWLRKIKHIDTEIIPKSFIRCPSVNLWKTSYVIKIHGDGWSIFLNNDELDWDNYDLAANAGIKYLVEHQKYLR